MAQSNSVTASPKKLSSMATQRQRKGLSWDNPWVWLSPALLILIAYSIFPLLYNLYISFFTWSQSAKQFKVPKEGSLSNWATLLSDPNFHNALKVTITYTLIALAVQLTLGMIIALLLDAGPWGAGIMQTLIILPMVTAPAVAGLIFRLLEHSEYGIISYLLYGAKIITKNEPLLGGSGQNALAAVLLVDVWQWTPFFTLIILAGLKGMPSEILEASQVDGASWMQRLLRIKIPLLFGVITVAILFRLVDLYKVFDYIVIMTSGGPANRTLTLAYYNYIYTFQQTKWGFGAAIGVFIMIIGWASAWLYQKVFRVKW